MNERQYVLELTRSRLAKAKERLSSVSATSMHSSPALIRLQTFVDEADDEIFQRRIGKLQRQEVSLFESPVHRDVTLRRHMFSEDDDGTLSSIKGIVSTPKLGVTS